MVVTPADPYTKRLEIGVPPSPLQFSQPPSSPRFSSKQLINPNLESVEQDSIYITILHLCGHMVLVDMIILLGPCDELERTKPSELEEGRGNRECVSSVSRP